MKLLLTSQGLYNETISEALIQLVDKKPTQTKVAFIPTAATFMDIDKDWLIKQLIDVKRQKFGYVDIVDIAALSKNEWKPRVEKSDVIVVGGGNPFHLMRELKKSGLGKMLPELLKTRVYVGNSSGSMVMGEMIPLKCKELYECETDEKKDLEGLGFVDFTFLPHLNDKDFTDVNRKYIKQLAGEIGDTVYALDNNTAIVIKGDKVKVVSEGEWEKFEG